MNRELLERPFEKEQIKQRKGSFGSMIDYVETHAVIQRLNDAFDGNWSFEIIKYERLDDEIIVLGKMTAEGITKFQFGSNKVSFTKSGEAISIGDDMKGAASDCIKKCATLFGVGLHLYAETKEEPSDDMSRMSRSKAEDTITKEQLGQIKQLRNLLGWSAEQLLDLSQRMFGTKEITGINQTMANALIAYLKNKADSNKEEVEF